MAIGIVVIINSTIINIISFLVIVVIMVIYSSRCYVRFDFWYLTSLLLYILIKLGNWFAQLVFILLLFIHTLTSFPSALVVI